MISNLDEYEEYIRKFLAKVPLCYTAQLKKILVNTYDKMTDDFASDILFAIQRRGYLILSPDGWAMTKGVVQRLTQQKFNENYIESDLYRLPSMSPLIKKSGLNLDILDCFWIAIDMLPGSEDFVIGSSPWDICFDVSGKSGGKLYQITKIPESKEDARCALLKSLPEIFDEHFKGIVRRIAVIENEKHAWMVPHIGFTHICKINTKNKRMYSIIEKRSADKLWEE